MSTLDASPLLRFAFTLDGFCSLIAGVLAASGAALTGHWLGITPSLALGLGLFMSAYGLAMLALGRQQRVPRWLALGIAGGNALWVVGSLVLLVAPWIQPAATGVAIILAQALAVAVFSVLQFLGVVQSREVQP